jgi:hypothetical protein
MSLTPSRARLSRGSCGPRRGGGAGRSAAWDRQQGPAQGKPSPARHSTGRHGNILAVRAHSAQALVSELASGGFHVRSRGMARCGYIGHGLFDTCAADEEVACDRDWTLRSWCGAAAGQLAGIGACVNAGRCLSMSGDAIYCGTEAICPRHAWVDAALDHILHKEKARIGPECLFQAEARH